MQINKIVMLAVCILGLSACGGGGGGNGNSNPQQKTYVITATAGQGGSATIETPSVAHGGKGKITAVANAGYGVDTFSGCGAGSTNYNIYETASVTADCSVSVTFKKVVVVQGTVAEGAALANAQVHAKCADGSAFTSKVETDMSGHFTGQVGESALPCALRVMSMMPVKTYYSIVNLAGTVNITPLTDLSITLASGKSGGDWFASADWKEVVLKLTEAQESLKNLLLKVGYDVPVGSFLPFTVSFEIGDGWDLLLDQLQAGINNSATIKTYDNLVAIVKGGNIDHFPSVAGDTKNTAEVCFNPKLFEKSTTLTIKRSSIGSINDIPTHSTSIAVYANDAIEENNGNVMQSVTSTITSDYSIYTIVYNSIVEVVVDKGKKTSAYIFSKTSRDILGVDGEDPESISSQLNGPGNQIHFALPRDEIITEEYSSSTELVAGVTSISSASHKHVSVFKGIVEIKRGGTTARVCQFDTHEEITRPPVAPSTEPSVFIRDDARYFLVGSGVEVSDKDIFSAVLNGEELLNTEPN